MPKPTKGGLQNRYKKSYETKDKGGSGGMSIMDWKKLDFEVKFFKPTEGNNRINIIPYVIKSKDHPLVRSKDAAIGELDYLLDVWVHKSVGAGEVDVLCLKKTYGKPCSLCEEESKFRSNGQKDEADDVKATRRVFYNVVNADAPKDGFQVFEVSHFLFEKELIEEARQGNDEGDLIDFASIEDGHIIKFRAEKTKKGGFEFMLCKSFAFQERSKPLKESYIDSAISFDEILRVPSYEDGQKILFGEDGGEEDEDETPRKAGRALPDDDDAAPEEDEDPPARSKAKTDDPEEDEDDAEPAPRGKEQSKKPKDEDDEDPPARAPRP